MFESGVEQLAELTEVKPGKLLEILGEAGIAVETKEQALSEADKIKLLLYLRRKRGNNNEEVEPNRIVLHRRSTMELKVPISGPQSRTRPRMRSVNIELHRSRTYVKRKELQQHKEELQEEQAVPSAETKPEVMESAAVAPQAEAPATEVSVEAPMQAATGAFVEAPAVKQASVEQQAPVEKQAPIEKQAVPSEPELPAPAPGPAADIAPIPVPATVAVPEAAEPQIAPPERPAQPPPPAPPKELHVSSERKGRRRKKRHIKSVATRTDPQHSFQRPSAPVVREVEIPESISVGELAQRMSIKAQEVIRLLMSLGTMATINQSLDQGTAMVLVQELGHKAKPVKEDSLRAELARIQREQGEQVPRPPVVTIMGHVDHGKTSLLDHIRRAQVASKEAGGITQHIGAYSVSLESGQKITFLDTPGHEAFTAMRARGTEVTDIVVLVVAADDGVMPQTREAIRHAQESSASIVVAINKIDKANADPDRVKQALYGEEKLLLEEWGGDTLCRNVSAKSGEGIKQLLDAILLQAELLDLKAPDKGAVWGTVIESYMDRNRGPVATILVQGGLLLKGDLVLSSGEYGRARSLINESGKELKNAGPSTPVEVVGLSGAPNVGEAAITITDERKAREYAEQHKSMLREKELSRHARGSVEDVFSNITAGQPDTLRVLIKADVRGSAEALLTALMKLATEEVKVDVISCGVGAVTESDVNLAKACQGRIIGFNVRADNVARKLIEEENIPIQYYNIIYEVVEDIRTLLSGMLSPEVREQIVGLAEVREVFHSPKLGDIAGCIVVSGIVRKELPIRVLREEVVIYEGKLESLRRFKEDVNEVQSGTECGIGVKNYNNVKVGDKIEVFERISQARTL